MGNSLTGVVTHHSKEIDEYIQIDGPMTRQEVVDKALPKLLLEVGQITAGMRH